MSSKRQKKISWMTSGPLYGQGCRALLGFVWITSMPAFSFEHTKVLPVGIQNLTIKRAETQITERTDNQRQKVSAASQLNQPLKLKSVLAKESKIKAAKLGGLLQDAFGVVDLDGYSLGSFDASMEASVLVTAPVMSYGVSDRWTIAVALPHYTAKSSVSVEFNPSLDAEKMIRVMNKNYGLAGKGREIAFRLQDPTSLINSKLSENGYRSLDDWSGSGFGDVTLASKVFLGTVAEVFRFSTTEGVILPTGATKDPDILHDIPFGQGVFQPFVIFAADQQIFGSTLIANEYVRFTEPLSSSKKMRMATDDEALAVGVKRVGYQMGSTIEYGTSVQFEADFGLMAGLGYMGTVKFEDRIDTPDHRVKVRGERGSDRELSAAKIRLGYSGVNLYKKGDIPAPVLANFEYQKHLSSRNHPVSDLITAEMTLLF